jgi:hypothetical protein
MGELSSCIIAMDWVNWIGVSMAVYMKNREARVNATRCSYQWQRNASISSEPDGSGASGCQPKRCLFDCRK